MFVIDTADARSSSLARISRTSSRPCLHARRALDDASAAVGRLMLICAIFDEISISISRHGPPRALRLDECRDTLQPMRVAAITYFTCSTCFTFLICHRHLPLSRAPRYFAGHATAHESAARPARMISRCRLPPISPYLFTPRCIIWPMQELAMTFTYYRPPFQSLLPPAAYAFSQAYLLARAQYFVLNAK